MNQNPESSPQIPDDSAGQAGVAGPLSLWGYFVKCLRMYAKFGGRARRREFWGFCLFASIYLSALLAISFMAGRISYLAKVRPWLFLVSLLFILVMYPPFMAVTARRFHDIGESGWWFILYSVTFPLSCLFLALLLAAMAHGSTMDGWVIAWIMFAQVLMAPFMFIWGLMWLCRDSEWSSNKYGECPSDVN